MSRELEDQAARQVVASIDNALLALACWCPHGMDSSRVSDYLTADAVREKLNEAKMHMDMENFRW